MGSRVASPRKLYERVYWSAPKQKKNSDLQILSCRTAIYGMFAVVILTELYAFWTTREGNKIDGSVERSFLMQLLEVIFLQSNLKKLFIKMENSIRKSIKITFTEPP